VYLYKWINITYTNWLILGDGEILFRRKKFFVCSVCGYDRLLGPLYNKKGIPDVSLICACCGFQPGYDDEELGYTIESYREEWLQNGAEWLTEVKNPKQWNLNTQLKNVSKETKVLLLRS
jgi:hypothetical protein